MVKSPNILAVGGAHIDRRGQVSGPYVPAASNPGTMREDVGGGVFNALRSVVKRGVSASLLSMRGGDAAAETVSTAIASAGIVDLSAVFLDRTTPSYTALIDRDGELIVGFADMALYDLAFPKQIRRAKVREAIASADALLCDANLPSAALERLVAQAAGKPVFAIAISPAKVVRLMPVLGSLAVLFMNRREAGALAGLGDDANGHDLVGGLRRAGLTSGVVTAGGEPVLGFDGEGLFSIAPPAPRRIADVTGAGDALTGATVAALLNGLPLRAALREGIAASILAIESTEAVPAFSAANFAQMLALVPGALEVA
ncbi:carbohydrate kinase [Mesorhizobium sp. M4A.F.Ca.ET.022.05.2.1]|uniref:carbohydrate kinase family protein n=2 Tax=unclassified Mesorhizobium TaxID=325217 RepID=UPI000FCBA37A|nr:carbohydrate kinase family protein [Mesorhizobium sp. M4A.F.Ca.ET.022.05.2.1]RVC76076.1 carbohydrate kinase [Mesorhizobium sp. M4A.F.Ca.ET.022.05.2.1]RVD71084.1 carbohydrate kinase [Mesorhizobium sp. M4A.F.Ca.ET.029.04.2.1]